MSNGRALRRKRKPPAYVLAALAKQRCLDCDSELSVRWRQGMWHNVIAHDDGCQQVAWRELHGATSSVVLIAQPGKTVSPEAIALAVKAVSARPGVVGVRVSDHSSLSWQERKRIDEALG